MCHKRGYASARLAWRAIRAARRDPWRPPLSAYRCPGCGQWHLKTLMTQRHRLRGWGWRKRRREEATDD